MRKRYGHQYQDKAYLTKQLKAGKRVEQIAAAHGVSMASIYHWMRRYGLRYRNKQWSQRDDNYVVFNAYHRSATAMAKHLGTTATAVRWRIRHLGLSAEKCIGYTMNQFAADCATDSLVLRNMLAHHDGHLHAPTGRIHINHDEATAWLQRGNVLRLYETIEQAAPWVRDIYAQAMSDYITTPELRQIAGCTEYQVRHMPKPVLRIETGRIYDREQMARYLALHSYLLYAGARGPYADYIRHLQRSRYIVGSVIEQYDMSVYRSLHHAYVHNGLPRPVRIRPNVWLREPFIEWLQAHSWHPKWAALLEYLNGIYQESEA